MEVFSLTKMVRKRIPRFFLFQKWFGTDFQGFSHPKWFGTEFQEFFSSGKWFGTEFRGFSLPRNRRNSDGTVACFVLFRIPLKYFFCRKMAILPSSLLFVQTGREGERDKYSAGRKNKKENKCICCMIIFLENCFSP
jgi:hypothetical protein